MATTLAALSDPLGEIFGYMLGPAYITNEDVKNPEAGKEKVNNLLLMQCYIVTGLCLPMILLMQERPKYFPSAAAKN